MEYNGHNGFELLLNDLYDKYNPSNKKEIPNIIQKYIGQELDAIYLFLAKYNYPKHPSYNPSFNDLNILKSLLVQYHSGNRMLILETPNISVADEIRKDISQETKKEITQTSEQLNKTLLQSIESFKKDFYKKLEDLNSKDESDVLIKLNLLYTESEIELPKEIKDFAINTRFLVKDINDKFIPLEIKDIFCDFISVEKGYIKEITIGKI